MALLTLDEAKDQLNLDTDANDVELQAYVDSLTAVIERYVGPVENRIVTEVVNARGRGLALSQAPVVSLTSLTPLALGGLAIAVGDLYLDPDAGVLHRLDGGVFYGGPWTGVYVAGRGEVVPPTINLAARMLLQHLWRTQQGQARGSSGADDVSVNEPIPGYGYAVPYRVLTLLEAYKLPPGVA